jgi:hypothetical protein
MDVVGGTGAAPGFPRELDDKSLSVVSSRVAEKHEGVPGSAASPVHRFSEGLPVDPAVAVVKEMVVAGSCTASFGVGGSLGPFVMTLPVTIWSSVTLPVTIWSSVRSLVGMMVVLLCRL